MPARIVKMFLLALALVVGACSRSEGGGTAAPPANGLPSASDVSAVPMGHIAGETDSAALARSIPNPYAGNAQAVEAGRALYLKMNCAGCHAYNAQGNMGPDLTDTYWRYGGYPIEIYRSIHDGRAQGMPAWGSALPPTEIWKLVAYIQSLGGSSAVDATAPAAQRAGRLPSGLDVRTDVATKPVAPPAPPPTPVTPPTPPRAAPVPPPPAQPPAGTPSS